MLKGKVAIITGARRGIGLGIAKKFAQNGCNIVINDIQGRQEFEKGSDKIRGIEGYGVKCQFVKADVSDGKQVADIVKKTIGTFGKIDILVNNAAHVAITESVFEITEDEWDRVLAVNLKGPFLLCKEVVPYMKESGSGRIINISAVSGLLPIVPFAHYNASKAGLNILTKDMALELANFNITVNCICPGLIRTELAESTRPERMDQLAYLEKFAKDNVPMGKPGYPEDVANAALFLASDQGGYITGEVLSVAGGVPLYRSRIPK